MRIAWFRDGKAGHENQALGLLEALRERTGCHWLERDARQPGTARWLKRNGPFALALGAGHRTHPALCRARLAGVPAVVIMRPSLPWWLAVRCFSALVVPAHDRPPDHPRILATHGALNRMRPGAVQPETGLVLLGGPSRHVYWDGREQLQRLARLLEAEPGRQWLLADSRRTPADTRAGLARLAERAGARYQPWDRCPPGWLAHTLPRQARVWVSADSVSMIYEALSTSAEVGLLPVRWRGAQRLADGLRMLVQRGWLLPLDDWLAGRPFPPRPVLREAQRAADWLLEREGFPCG